MRRDSLLVFLVLGLVACGSGPTTAEPLSEERVPPKTLTSIGVAPFERVGSGEAEVPDVALLLARRLSTRGVERVVGPVEMRVAAAGDPRPDEVVEWADRAGVEALVVGRTTRLGKRLSVDARVRSGRSGAELGSPFYADAAGAEELSGAVDALAGEVLARLETATAVPAAADPGAAAAAAGSGAAKPAKRPSSFRRDEPIAIHSDELEAVQRAGGRQFVFSGHVRAEQGEMLLQSDHLEALYPSEASQPDRLVATGNVVLVQGARRATCDRAVYLRDEGRLICTGHALLEEGCDRVRGDEIVFGLESDLLEVKGAADVRIHPRGAACEPKAEARR